MTIKNTGNVGLTNVVSVAGCATALLVGASSTCKTAVPASTQALFEAGGAAGWTTKVTVTTAQGAKDGASATTLPVYTPGVTLTIAADRTTMDASFTGNVRYTINVTNSAAAGSNTRWNTTAITATAGGVSLAVTCPQQGLALGASMVCPAVRALAANPDVMNGLQAPATHNVVAAGDASKTASATARVGILCRVSFGDVCARARVCVCVC